MVALPMLVGVDIVDLLIVNVVWNLGFNAVHTVALKTYTGWARGRYVIFRQAIKLAHFPIFILSSFKDILKVHCCNSIA